MSLEEGGVDTGVQIMEGPLYIAFLADVQGWELELGGGVTGPLAK